jgi:hypothetical protein
MANEIRPCGQMYAFDIALASKCGIVPALLVHHFQHWIRVNKNRKANFRDGSFWTYQTYQEITDHFPFLTIDQVRRAIEKLVKLEILKKSNYNKQHGDKTIWFAFVNENIFVPDLPIMPKDDNNSKQSNPSEGEQRDWQNCQIEGEQRDWQNCQIEGDQRNWQICQTSGKFARAIPDTKQDTKRTTNYYGAPPHVDSLVSSSSSSNQKNSSSHEESLASQASSIPQQAKEVSSSSFKRIKALEELPLSEAQKSTIYSMKTDVKGNPITEERILKGISCLYEGIDDVGGFLFKAIYNNYERKMTAEDRKKLDEQIKQQEELKKVKTKEIAIKIVEDLQKNPNWATKFIYFKDRIEFRPKGRADGCISLGFNSYTFFKEFTDLLKSIGESKYLIQFS